MRIHKFVCLLGLVLAAGCATPPPATVAVPNLPHAMPVDPPSGSHMLTANIYAGDALHKMLLLRMNSGGGILTTSLVNMNDFEESSAFGRVTAQQVGSRIGQYGFRVLESRLGDTLAMERRSGEFMLTRDACKLLADTYDASAVLVGCYSEAGSNVFVSVRVVRLSDNAIMGAYEYYLPRDGDVTRLLASSSSGGTGGASYGGDGIWNMYAVRTSAFQGANARKAKTTAQASPAGTAREIDPAAPPARVSGKKKKR